MHAKSVLLSLILPAVVARAERLTESQAVAEALQNNFELRSLQARIESARRGVGAAKTYSFNPEFNFEEGLDRHFGVSQTIEWPGKRALRAAMARQDVAAAEAALDGFKVALVAEVRARFSELLAAQNQAEVQQRRVKAVEAFFDTARKRVEGGFAPITERAKAQADLVKARRELRRAQKTVEIARASLNLLLGREPRAPLELAGETTLPATDAPLSKWLAAAAERNPELRVQRIELEKRGLAVRLAGKEAAPDISVEPFYEHDAKNSRENKIGVAVSIPLPVWRTSRPFVNAATAEKTEAEAVYEKLRREVAANVAQAYAGLVAAREELALFAPELMTELETQLSATQEKYANGQITFLVLLETQNTYFDYRKDFYDALAAVRAALSELEKAAGISVEDLK